MPYSCRFFVFDCETKRFTGIGDKETWNERCILCVGHFFQVTSSQSRLIVYASDTAGYVSFWDATQLYAEPISRHAKDIEGTDISEGSFHRTSVFHTSVTDARELKETNGFKNITFPSQNHYLDVQNKLKSKENFVEQICARKLHQSGVNSVSLSKQGKIKCTAINITR